MRKTHALVQIAMVRMADPSAMHWGYVLGKQAGVRYPMLTRMLGEGWLADGWEDTATITQKRPQQHHHHELTDLGEQRLGRSLQEARSDARLAHLRFVWA